MKHADTRTLELRFTIGQILALTWRAWLACRWHIVLIGVPSAVAAVGALWLTSSYIAETVPTAWQGMVRIWSGGVVQCFAYVAITFAALSYMQGQSLGARDVLRLPWRRLPAALAAGLVLQGITWWPEPLLDWPVDGDDRIVIDYAILTINVLAFDVLAFVWLPVLVIESRSIVSTFRRAASLAARHPWRLLAIDIGFWCVYFLFNEALRQAYLMIDPEWAYLAWSATVAVWIVLSMSAACCLAAAAYHLIRSEHEGPAPETLARVFD